MPFVFLINTCRLYIFTIQCYHTTIFTTYGRQPQTSHLNGMQRDPQKYQGTFRTLTFFWICKFHDFDLKQIFLHPNSPQIPSYGPKKLPTVPS